MFSPIIADIAHQNYEHRAKIGSKEGWEVRCHPDIRNFRWVIFRAKDWYLYLLMAYKFFLMQVIILDFSTCRSFIVAEYSILSTGNTGTVFLTKNRLNQLRIRGLFIWIYGSVSLDYGSFSGFQDANKKLYFFSKGFCLLVTTGTLKSVFKDNKLLRSHKAVEIRVFSKLLLVDGWIREAQKHTDLPTDLDPWHWLKCLRYLI